jgi:polyferredoxin
MLSLKNISLLKLIIETNIKMGKRNINYLRLIIQWSILLILAYMVIRLYIDKQYIAYYEKYCPFGGIQALSSYLVTNKIAYFATSIHLAFGLALIICIVIFSKLFCGYICPIGTFTEWLGKLGEKFKLRFTVKGFADRALRILKYGLLFFTFYFTIKTGELFCKKYDPYYAGFTGFGSGVIMLYAIIAMVAVVLGSIFIRMSWCKYLCPLSAATNIFANFILFIGLLVTYILLVFVFKIQISWVWLLAVICLLSFLKEASMMRVKIFPILKITRNPDTCTLCRKCDKVCPMAIKVSESGRVNHIDCHLCCDCIVSCPEKDVLRINRRNIRWMPPLAVVLLIAAAIWFSSYIKIPAISERWGTPQQMGNSKVFSKSGLKNIKCYGSSMSFAEQMKDVKGVLGVETYLNSNTVKVFYDPSLINEEGIKKAIFIPSAVILNEPVNEEIGVMNFKIGNYFDPYDEYYLTELLSANPAVYGFSTTFGEPVNLKVYFNPVKLSSSKIIAVIESPEIKIKDGKTESIQKNNFKIQYAEEKFTLINLQEFYTDLTPAMDDTFNKFSRYKSTDLSIYEILLSSFNKEIADQLPYLESHLSNNNGIVGFKTRYTKDGVYVQIIFVKSMTNTSDILKLLTAPKLKVYFDDGSSKERDNPFIPLIK